MALNLITFKATLTYIIGYTITWVYTLQTNPHTILFKWQIIEQTWQCRHQCAQEIPLCPMPTLLKKIQCYLKSTQRQTNLLLKQYVKTPKHPSSFYPLLELCVIENIPHTISFMYTHVREKHKHATMQRWKLTRWEILDYCL